jgi:hypothetical protein
MNSINKQIGRLNMKAFKTMSSMLAGLMLLSSAAAVMATDISRDVRGNGSGANLENGGYFSIGAGVLAGKGTWQNKDENDTGTNYGEFTFALSGAYRRGGLFVEAEQGSLDGLNLGYTLWNNNAWTADVLISVPGGSLGRGEKEYVVASNDQSEQERSNNLLDRLKKDRWLAGTGFRVTGYLSDYVVQYRLLTDVHKGRGLFSSLRFGRSWQLKNWNLYSLLSAEYYSEEINDDLYGVSSEEATERFAEYHAGAGGWASAKIGLTYPLSEHWVVEASALARTLSKAEKDSPLMNSSDYHAFTNVSIHYVF